MQRFALACVLAISLPRVAVAEDPAADRPTERRVPSREIEIDVPGERSLNNKLLVGGILAAGILGTGLGLYWHLDSRDAANAVSADGITGRAWTQEQVDLVDRAARSKTRATIAYSVGGAFLIGAVVTYILTAPKTETTVIRTGVMVTPTSDGGTVVSKMWSF